MGSVHELASALSGPFPARAAHHALCLLRPPGSIFRQRRGDGRHSDETRTWVNIGERWGIKSPANHTAESVTVCKPVV